MRIYHPDHRITWVDRLLDPLGVRVRRPRPDGVDFTLLNRAAARSVRGFLQEAHRMSLLGDEMVRVDSGWRPPDGPTAMRAALESFAARLRFVQQQPGGLRAPVGIRWLDLDAAPHGSRLLLRLLQRPNPGLRSSLEGDLSEDGSGGWEEQAIGGD